MIDGKEISLKEWKERFERGDFASSYVLAQIMAGWYDWFCDDNELAGKTDELGEKAIQLFGSPMLNQDKDYIWFKNNCPVDYPLYDDFRFADIESGDVKYTICHFKNQYYGEKGGRWEVWDFSTKGQGSCLTHEAVVVGSWKDVKKFFKVA